MPHILEVLHARCAEIAGEAILSGEEHPHLTLTAHEVEELLSHIAELHRRQRDIDQRYTELRHATGAATLSLERIRTVLEQRTAHPEAQVRQACTIARFAAQNLTESTRH